MTDMIDELSLLVTEGIRDERENLAEIRADKDDRSSYGAGYSTGYIQAFLDIKTFIAERQSQ